MIIEETKKGVFHKCVAVFCSYILIAALFMWGGSFVSGENQLDFDINGVDLEFTSEGFSDNEMTAVTEGDEGAQTLTITIGDGDDKREYKISNIKDGAQVKLIKDDKGVGFTVENGEVSDELHKVSVKAGSQGIYFGDGEFPPDGYEGRHITLRESSTGALGLGGSLSALEEGDTVSFTNNRDEKILAKGIVSGAKSEFSIPAGETGEFFEDSTGVNLRLPKDGSAATKSSRTEESNGDDTNKPGLPEPQNDITTGDPTGNDNNNGNNNNNNGNNNNGFSPGSNGNGIPPDLGNTGGGGGGIGASLSKMLPWILIIGGGVLAAMFLFGDDEEEEKEDDDRRVRSDGGEEYYDPSQEIGDEYDEPGEVGGPIVEYNPTEPAGEERFCTCDESGCFNCPPGEDGTENCFACSPDNDEPEVQ